MFRHPLLAIRHWITRRYLIYQRDLVDEAIQKHPRLAEEREQGLLQRARAALSATGFWEKFDTDWVCIDAELMPWSEKARPLLKDQYAAVGAADASDPLAPR